MLKLDVLKPLSIYQKRVRSKLYLFHIRIRNTSRFHSWQPGERLLKTMEIDRSHPDHAPFSIFNEIESLDLRNVKHLFELCSITFFYHISRLTEMLLYHDY